jgi:PEP-CTERM motif-containing protein
MRKPLWIIPLLFAGLGAPSARADTFNATFICIGACVSTPTALDVTFPSPTTMTVTWDTFTFPINLLSGDAPFDSYIWSTSPTTVPGTSTLASFFFVEDTSTTLANGVFLPNPNAQAITDNGTLTFSAVPEPSSLALMLLGLGVGLVFVMGKRKGQGLTPAT